MDNNIIKKLNIRFKKSLNNCLNDLAYIKAYLPLYDKFAEQKDTTRHFNSFYFSAIAIFNDIITRSIRVLDLNKEAAGFWYIYHVKTKKLLYFIETSNTTFEKIEKLSKSLKIVRDKIHFHFDTTGIMNPKEVWGNANINYDFLKNTIDEIFKILIMLYEDEFKEPYQIYEYNANEVHLIYKACRESEDFKKIFMPCILHYY